jgi:3-phenylpropionate/cinnamic acid dioxygenase small subunit
MAPLTLADKLELHELAGRYGDAIDDRAWERLDHIFTEDAVFEVRGLDIVMNGLHEIKAFMDEAGDRHPQAHLMTNIYCLQCDGRVELRCRGLFPEANRLADDKSSVVYHGSYYDTVVKTAAGWRIRHRIYVRGRMSD